MHDTPKKKKKKKTAWTYAESHEVFGITVKIFQQK